MWYCGVCCGTVVCSVVLCCGTVFCVVVLWCVVWYCGVRCGERQLVRLEGDGGKGEMGRVGQGAFDLNECLHL